MKKLFLPLFACCSLWAQADDAPLWLRYPALSPDGREIAFTYKGDIYTVPVEGGRAVQLTTNPRHDTRPVWSPDGRYIAFASDREGSFDVYLMAREGGTPRRLTTHSGNEYPETFKDNETILFTASIRPDVKDSQFPSSLFPQIYAVGTKGGRPVLFSSLAMQELSLSRDGRRLHFDLFGNLAGQFVVLITGIIFGIESRGERIRPRIQELLIARNRYFQINGFAGNIGIARRNRLLCAVVGECFVRLLRIPHQRYAELIDHDLERAVYLFVVRFRDAVMNGISTRVCKIEGIEIIGAVQAELPIRLTAVHRVVCFIRDRLVKPRLPVVCERGIALFRR